MKSIHLNLKRRKLLLLEGLDSETFNLEQAKLTVHNHSLGTNEKELKKEQL